MLSYAVWLFFQLVFIILLIYALLTWIPNINWYNEPFRTLQSFANIFFAPFRKLIPPIGMIDISPVVAFIVLSIVARLIVSCLQLLHL